MTKEDAVHFSWNGRMGKDKNFGKLISQTHVSAVLTLLRVTGLVWSALDFPALTSDDKYLHMLTLKMGKALLCYCIKFDHKRKHNSSLGSRSAADTNPSVHFPQDKPIFKSKLNILFPSCVKNKALRFQWPETAAKRVSGWCTPMCLQCH